MNDQPPERLPLDEHLAGITSGSNGVKIKAAVVAALADGWPRTDVLRELEARGVGPSKIKNAFPPPPKLHMPRSEGLASGLYRKADGSVCTLIVDRTTGEAIETPICNDLQVLFRTTDGEGGDASIIVETINIHGERRQTRLSAALAHTDVRAAISQLIVNGLKPARRGEKPYAEILDAVLNAEVPRARYLTETGHCDFQDAKAFALPSGVIGAQPDAKIIWAGGTRLCRVGARGSLDEWRSAVAALCDGNAIPMVAIGTMLASPAIPLLPEDMEVNTMIHIVGDPGTGKTTTLRIGASVWGAGRDTSDPDSFVDSWRTTGNASENLLAGHNHVGVCLDELHLIDPKAALAWAYEFASGRSKHRMNRDISSRQLRGWQLFPLSSGEKTLKDHAADAPLSAARIMDSGADVRVLNIHAKVLFLNLHGRADGETFAQELALVAAKIYGSAGPAFVAHLLADEASAREWLTYWRLTWATIAAGILPQGPSLQAKRVASRLGSIVCGAAYAADMLELPWVLPNDTIGQTVAGAIGDAAPVGVPARAMVWAFATILKIWIDENGGGGASTGILELIEGLRNFHASRPQYFASSTFKQPGAPARRSPSPVIPPPSTNPITDDGVTHAPSFEWGWDVTDGANPPLLLFVDVKPSLFTDRQGLGWSLTNRKRLVAELNARGLLITIANNDTLQNTHSVKGRNVRVYRIKGDFFDV